ncbi:MAG TPA: TlpA disulfide reductase family protein [Burkholderiaceae bacterium]|nr:TlpA disulfide reductase family protein [Burkholderiaceae bacterium]
MPRSRSTAAALVAAVLAASSPAPPARAAATDRPAPVAGDPVPAIELATDDGALALAAQRGKVVLLDFWASWCAPCRRSFPWMNALHERYGPQGLVVLAVNVDARGADARRFLAETPASFRVAWDPAGEAARRFAIRAMPSSVLVGADGRVLSVHAGFRDGDADALEARIRDALARR